MNLTKLFSLNSRLTFFLLVVILSLFSIAAWWSVQRLIWSEVDARLKSGAERIETILKERFNGQANALAQMRGYLPRYGQLTQLGFKQLVMDSEFVNKTAGLQFVGYAEIFRLSAGEGDQSFKSVIKFIESRNISNSEFGVDLPTTPAIKDAIQLAQNSGGAAIAANQARFGAEKNSLTLLIPATKSGMLFAQYEARGFFDGIFGDPSKREEAVNFTLSAPAAGPLYSRFENSDRPVSSLTLERHVFIHGADFVLNIYPLPHFFSFGDKYLALLVGLGAALVSCMVMLVMRASQNQLDFEILAKEASMETARENRRQLENLRQLNAFDRSLAGELDASILVEKFSSILKLLPPVDASFLYFKDVAKSPQLRIRATVGVADTAIVREELPEIWLEKVVTQSLVLRKGDRGSEEIIRSLVRGAERFSDWFLLLVVTREGGRCGLVFVAKENKQKFSEVEKELFESIVTQFANSAEIAQLFLRVEDANKAKNAFLANMSHEIRTPLGAIIGFSEIMNQGHISAQQRANLIENLRKNSEQLTCIIDDILDLSKVEAGKLKIIRRSISLPSLLQEIKSVMMLRARGKKIQFSVETSGSIPVQIDTDEIRLKQVLLNLIGNAIKFTDNGNVRLIVRHLMAENKKNIIAFTVRDSGIGISDEHRPALFSPFTQVDMSKTRRFGGSGLGLVLSRRLAQELGGTVELLESIPGQGSTFEARIEVGDLTQTNWVEKLFPKAHAAAVPLRRLKHRLDGARILLVEDSEDNQDIFRHFLEGSGARAEIVANGNEAVEKANTGTYDLILMDIQIPGIDGKEATRRIRQSGFKPPIVALTAHAMLEEKESCLSAGCIGQITKPISGDALVDEVAKYLRRA